jgi:hypothetical protein
MKKILFLSMLISLCACSGGGGEGDDIKPVKNEPAIATLVFPNANSECTDGTNKTATESTIKFEWIPGANAEYYGLIVKNLNSGVSTTYSTTKSFYELKLMRGIAYSWFVISSSASSTVKASSEIRKFYNADESKSSYAPFPAEAVSPLMNATVTGPTITLDWSASDVDNDIVNYEVLFGTTLNPISYKKDIVESILSNLPVEAGKTYYWKIITKDSKGNSSVSEIFKFKVN